MGEALTKVAVVYVGPQTQFYREMVVDLGTTAAMAVELSGLTARFPEIATDRLAIFGRRVDGDTTLRLGDRVEVLRPLKVSPMEARRRRAVNTAETPTRSGDPTL